MGLIHLLIAVVALVNVIASVAVLRVSVFSTQQRLLQLVLIWFVPIIGAVVCAAFASSQALGPAPLNKMDPLYDRGAPEGPGIGICGCGNIDSGGDGGGGSD